MDEPLSNLDAKLRVQMRTEISKLHNRLQTTFIYVTHDQTEAMTMGTRIIVMKDGFIQQVDTPATLYTSPCNMFVAGFIGSPQMNFVDVMVNKKDDGLFLEFGDFSVRVPDGMVARVEAAGCVGKEVVLGIRPEDIHDEEAMLSSYPESNIDAHVDVTEMMGAETYLYLKINGQPFTARVNPRSTAKPGDDIKVVFDTNKIHLFDKETEKALLN